MSILTAIIGIIVDAFIFFLLLRLLFHKLGVIQSNSATILVEKITNPVVEPLQAFMPKVKGFDVAVIVVVLVVELVKTMLVLSMRVHALPGLAGATVVSLGYLSKKVIAIYFWSIIIFAVTSWVPALQHASFVGIVDAITRPPLQYTRRWLPRFAGIDWSPLLLLLLLKAFEFLVVRHVMLYGLRLAY